MASKDNTSRFSSMTSVEKLKCFVRYLIILVMNAKNNSTNCSAAMKGANLLVNSFVIADFLGAINHWIADNYFEEDTPYLEFWIKENRDHHKWPGKCLDSTMLDALKVPTISSAVAALILSRILPQDHHPYILGVAAWSSIPLIVHKNTHAPESQREFPIAILQGLIFQSREEHQRHHDKVTECYATIAADLWNPILDGFKFWDSLEHLIRSITGVESNSQKIKRLRSKL